MAEYEFPHTWDKTPEKAEEKQRGSERRGRRPQRGSILINKGKLDLPFLALTMVILTIGVIMVLSASFARAYYETGNPTKIFIRQLFFAVSGVALMILASRVGIKIIRMYSKVIMLACIFLLILVLAIGTIGGGSKRWIDLGFTTFQPSEMAKLAVILYFAAMACRYKNKMKTFRYGILPFLGYLGVIVILLALEPHFSAIIIIGLLSVAMMFAGGSNMKHLAILAVIGAGGIALLLLTTGYTSDRITAWRDPFSVAQGDGWQIVQSLYAVGSGGLLGLGLGQGRQKYLYLPEEHNDYIFSIACEELGFIGAMLILVLFALLIIRGYWIALRARDRYSALITIGITTLLAIQVFLNVAVVTNFIPSTGISLPFFSYGGTALWMQMIEMGIILGVSRNIEDM